MATITQHPSFGGGSSSTFKDIPCVDSSFLENFRYDPGTLQLTVTMKSGAQYLHFFVYPNVIEELIKSPSKGKFYAQMIKGKTQATKVTHKEIGPQVRNPLKGPVQHEQRITKQIIRYRA